ncbi:MAG: tRNA (uridine(54)-C5)-methyltransferase TrmA, partial [Pseudomonas sp.]
MNPSLTDYAAQLAEKKARLQTLLATFNAPEPDVFDSPAEQYRLRAEF